MTRGQCCSKEHVHRIACDAVISDSSRAVCHHCTHLACDGQDSSLSWSDRAAYGLYWRWQRLSSFHVAWQHTSYVCFVTCCCSFTSGTVYGMRHGCGLRADDLWMEVSSKACIIMCSVWIHSNSIGSEYTGICVFIVKVSWQKAPNMNIMWNINDEPWQTSG